MKQAAGEPSQVDLLVRDEQIRQHRLTLPATVAGSALLALIVAIVQSRAMGVLPAAGWLLTVALVLGTRIAVYHWHEHADPAHQQAQVWIRRYRLLSFAHGLVWASACYWLFPDADLSHQLFLAFALSGICISSLSGYAFDLRAALMFCLPLLLAMLLRMLMLGTDIGVELSMIGMLFIVYVLAIALRANRTMREAVALRGTQAWQLADVHRSHAQLQRAEALAGLGSFSLDSATGGLTWSDGHFRLWGLAPGSVVPDRALFLAGVHPDDRERVARCLQDTIDGRRIADCLYQVCWPDGNVRHMLGRSEIQHDAHGKVVAITGTVQDVTQQTLTEASLVEKQQLLSVMQQTTQLGFWFVGPDGRTTGVNPALRAMLGRSADAALTDSILDCVDTGYARRLRLSLSGADVSGEPAVLVDVNRADGTVIHCLAHETALVDASGQVTGLLVMLSDLSAIERARAAQHVSEFVVNSVNDMVSVTDLEGLYHFVNDAWCTRHAMRREQVLGRPLAELLPAVASAQRSEALRKCIEGQQLQVVRAEVDYPQLGLRSMETTMTPYLTSDTQVRGVVAVTRDVTEQEATRAALAQSLDNLQRAFNATTDGMVAYDAADPVGQLLFANDRFFEIWNMPLPAAQATRHDVMAAAEKLFVDAPWAAD